MPENCNTFGEKFDLSNSDLEGSYNLAYALYQNGKYKDSQSLFTLLTLLNPLEKKFLMGFGAASQMIADYERALEAYARVVIIDVDDPHPHFHAAECYFALNNKEEALKALLDAEKRSSKDKELLNKIEILRG